MKTISRIGLIVFGIFIPLLFLEILFRLISVKDIWGMGREVFGEKLRDCLQKDPLLHHTLIPSCRGEIKTKDYTVSLKTNSFGFRDDEYYPQKSEGVFRILLVGDSFTEGWGVEVEDRFDRVMERILTDSTESISPVSDPLRGNLNSSVYSFEIINAGVRSHSPILHIEYVSKVLTTLEPDLVIMMVDLSDLHDDYYYGGWERHYALQDKLLKNRITFIEEFPPDDEMSENQLLQKSSLFNVVYKEYQRRYLNSNKLIKRENLSTDVSLFAKATEWENYTKSWNLTIANILLMNEYLSENDTDFVVSIIPRGIHVDKNEWSEGREILQIQKGILYEPKAYFYIDKELKKNNVTSVDLHIPLSSSNIFPLYYPYDGHWTKEGNEIVGRVFAEYLTKTYTKK